MPEVRELAWLQPAAGVPPDARDCGTRCCFSDLVDRDIAAALGEHLLATRDEHCGYFRRRRRGQADRHHRRVGPRLSNAP